MKNAKILLSHNTLFLHGLTWHLHFNSLGTMTRIFCMLLQQHKGVE